MSRYLELQDQLKASPRRWLVTGAAGFIGSALVEKLLSLGQSVTGVDNFLTGRRQNLDDLATKMPDPSLFNFIEGDICDPAVCDQAVAEAELVLHQAALGSVPRSIENPLATHKNNVTGFINILDAARRAGVAGMVYASSSSVYGDHPDLPKREEVVGRPMSPYAASKRIDEMYADVFGRVYDLEITGLRYFNVFGRRQDPNGPYAAVIPRWIHFLTTGETCVIFGDGSSSRDFCYVDNVVQANLLAATAGERTTGTIYNVGAGGNTTLLELFSILKEEVGRHASSARSAEPRFEDFRPGDLPHSQASIERITESVGYVPSHAVADGLRETVDWFVANSGNKMS